MRIAWFAACVLAAWTCIEKAVGAEEQQLFAPDMIWLWWPAVIGWGMAAIATMSPRIFD